MRDRRKRNIIIGSLCCLLVFMGIGYALLSQTLNINGIANLTGKWKIYIDSITVKEVGGSAKSNQAEVTEDKLTANFDVELLKPGDYVEYDVVVKNEGTINAVLRELIPNIESNNMDILLTHSIIQGQILKAESETKFTLKIRFDERATEIVSGGQTSFDIQMVYEQYDGDAESIDPSLVPVTANDCFTVDENGVITEYDYSCGTYVTVPAVVNGTTVTEISSDAFLVKNIIAYMSGSTPAAVVAFDDEAYILAADMLKSEYGLTEEMLPSFLFMKGTEPMDQLASYQAVSQLLTTTGLENPVSEIEYLDLSQANGLKIINAGAFLTSKTNPSLKYLNLDGVNIESFGKGSFDNMVLNDLTLDSDLYTVLLETSESEFSVDTLRIYPNNENKISKPGDEAFDSQINVDTLIISEGVTIIESGAFSYSYLTINQEVVFPESLVEIGGGAFGWQEELKEIKLPSNLKIIGDRAFSECDGLSSITIPASVERIGAYAFENISGNITSLTFEEGSKLVYIGHGAFQYCPITSLDFSPIKQKFEIGVSAFQHAKITQLFIDDVKIGRSAFYEAPLEKVELVGDVEFYEYDDSYAVNIGSFMYSDELKEVIIRSNTLKRIPKNTFKDAPLTKLELLNEDGTKVNSSITHIGESAFYSTVDSEIILPTTIEEIGLYAFFSMPEGSVIKTSKPEGSFAALNNWNGNAEVVYNWQ